MVIISFVFEVHVYKAKFKGLCCYYYNRIRQENDHNL